MTLSSSTPSRAAKPAASFYERLGVRPLINAAGVRTMLGGSLMLPEVKQAMEEASRHYVNLRELHEAAGERVARLIGVEAALVTSGAAAALTLSAAACVTKGNPDLIERLPDLTGQPHAVLVQRSHRHEFDRAIRNVGARFVEVETREELERAISPAVAMMHFLVYANRRGKIGMEEWTAVAREHGIPSVLDAAADIPPAGNLRKYTDLGFDLVAFSGGKALRGPQSSGLLLGRKHLVQWAFRNGAPFPNAIGRGCKVGKEEIAGLVTAVELYVRRDHAAQMAHWEAVAARWEAALRKTPGVTVERVGPENAGNVPYVRVSWDERAARFTHEDCARSLRGGTPRIELWLEDDGLFLTPFMLEEGQEDIVIQRLCEVLATNANFAG